MGLTKEETKAAMKEAIKEWLDQQFLQFGKWSAHVIGASFLGGLLYFILKSKGWSFVGELTR